MNGTQKARELRELTSRVNDGDITALAKIAERLRLTKAAHVEWDGMPLFQRLAHGRK